MQSHAAVEISNGKSTEVRMVLPRRKQGKGKGADCRGGVANAQSKLFLA